MADPIDVVLQFIQSINQKDIESLESLMTENHRYVDAGGKMFKGRSMMLQNWKSYFQWFPDYFIEVENYFLEGDLVGLFGFASGSYMGSENKDHKWRQPCAWRIQIKGNQIEYWQVYSDTRRIHSIMENYVSE
ncbi:MAG: nuclear transport factor 2 family protein [Chitinophagales bacterium]|nr:nuclear transport factor 2 family protein [Chitinophagales bacterium]